MLRLFMELSKNKKMYLREFIINFVTEISNFNQQMFIALLEFLIYPNNETKHDPVLTSLSHLKHKI